jgi:hypothetical protein
MDNLQEFTFFFDLLNLHFSFVFPLPVSWPSGFLLRALETRVLAHVGRDWRRAS